MTEKTETTAVALITKNDLSPQFGDSAAFVKKYEKFASEINVKDDDTLNAAENASGTVNDFLKTVDEKRKLIKAPYLEATRTIDAFVKGITDPLTNAKTIINTNIANYKRVQEAAARAEQEAKEAEATKLADEKSEEIQRISRIESQLIARIYGGYWLNREGQRKTSSGCVAPKDCADLLEVIQKTLPPRDSFIHMGAEYDKMITDVKIKLSEHNASLIELQSSSKTISDNARKEIEDAKMNATREINDKRDELTSEVISETRKVIKEAEKEVHEAGKGVRRTVMFEISDITEVPMEWLALDETKVREWANANKELVKKEMKDGNGIIKGIKFTYKETYVAR